MEFLNIGIPELAIILLLMLILLGPEGMVKTARTLAQAVRKLIRSPLWADLMRAQNEIKEIPTRLVREAGIDELQEEVRKVSADASRQINSINQPAPIDPYGIQSYHTETPLPGDSPEPVGPVPEEPPAGQLPADNAGEDKP
jgi:sec-independent protein translocase protein TatB